MPKAVIAKVDAGKQRLERAAALVDELGQIEREIAREYAATAMKVGSKPGRAGAIRAEILKLYEDAQADVPFSIEGEAFAAMLAARTNQTCITAMAKVAKLLGRERFLAAATVTLGTLRKELTPQELAACTKTERTGPRSLSVVERGIAA
jgi:hypothetical protein